MPFPVSWGRRRGSAVESSRLNMSAAGVLPVMAETVVCCSSKNLASLHENLPVWFFANACFVSLTIPSTCPFLAGWYGVLVVCVTPFLLKSSMSDKTKDGPLPVTIFSGIPKVAKRFRNSSIIVTDCMLRMLHTSSHCCMRRQHSVAFSLPRGKVSSHGLVGEGSLGWCLLVVPTSYTAFSKSFNVGVDTKPPKMTPCSCLHGYLLCDLHVPGQALASWPLWV